jgi:hypothetical protein
MFTKALNKENASQKAKMFVNGKFVLKAIMGYAWQVAKNLQKMFGGKVSAYLAEAMKRSWSIAKG